MNMQEAKERITEIFRDFDKAESLKYGGNSQIDGLIFTNEIEGKTDYDYDTESETGDFHVYSVKVADGKVYVKIKLYYTSYNGLQVRGYSFVEPQQKTITVFE